MKNTKPSQICSTSIVSILALVVIVARAPTQAHSESASQVTYEARLTQANPATLQALSAERGRRQRGRQAPDASRAFATPDQAQVFVLRKQFRPGQLERNQKNPNAYERMTTLRLQAPIGREALYLVGAREPVPTIANPSARRSGPEEPLSAETAGGTERDFGLLLRFLAVRMADGGLRIRVRPTVATPEFGQSTEKNGRFVPAINARGISI